MFIVFHFKWKASLLREKLGLNFIINKFWKFKSRQRHQNGFYGDFGRDSAKRSRLADFNTLNSEYFEIK